MLKELQSVLENFDYEEALEWFTAHVPGKFFIKDLLGTGEDVFNRKKLIEELRVVEEALLEERKKKESEPESLAPEPDTKTKPTVVAQAASSPEVQLLDEEWKPLYKEANYHFTTLAYLKTDEERMEAAFKVLDLMDQVEEIWEKKDFINRHGEMPDYEWQGVDQMSEADMMRRVTTLRTYISKANKGKLSADKLPEWTAEKEDLERRLRR